MAKIRKDSKGRNLRPGEYQRGDGLYAYAYTLHGKRKWIYASDLADLRKQAKQIEKDMGIFFTYIRIYRQNF